MNSLPVKKPPMLMVLRFYGRFVFVRSNSSVTALAIDMQSINEERKEQNEPPIARHDPFLTIRERNVDRQRQDKMNLVPQTTKQTNAILQGQAQLNDRTPTHRIMPGNVVAYDGCRLLYDLNNCDVTVPSVGELKWEELELDTNDKMKLAPLDELVSGQQHPKLKQDVLAALAPKPPVSARISITAGFCTPFHEFDEKLSLMKYKFGSEPPQFLADMVQVVTFSEQDVVAVTIGGQQVTVKATPLLPTDLPPAFTKTADWHDFVPRGAVLTFTNLCTSSPKGPTDDEFAAYYDIFEKAPPLKARPVPTASVGESIMTLWPSRDCFLSAQVILS